MPWFTGGLIWGSRLPLSLWGYTSCLYLLPNQLFLMCVRFSIFRHFLAGCLQIFYLSMIYAYVCTCEYEETNHLHCSYFFFSVV